MPLTEIHAPRSKCAIFYGTLIMDSDDTPWGVIDHESKPGYFYYCEELSQYHGPYPDKDTAILLGDAHYNALDSL